MSKAMQIILVTWKPRSVLIETTLEFKVVYSVLVSSTLSL